MRELWTYWKQMNKQQQKNQQVLKLIKNLKEGKL